jgi:3-deoxy-D-manno-octulosonic-acid transferase
VAGSTWAPEEKTLAAAFAELRQTRPNLRLIVAPRHVERADEIVGALAPLRVARRSRLEGALECDVLLVDTTGELRDWYRLATIVFVGKTLPGVAEVGGQNMGEPAALGLPVVFGPHTENFPALVAHLQANDAGVAIAEGAELPGALRALLGDPARRAAMGARAKEVLAPHQGAAARTAEVITQQVN